MVAQRTPKVGGRLAIVLLAVAAILALFAGFAVTFVFHFPPTLTALAAAALRANEVVTISIDQEDGASGLRNAYWAKAQGIIGGTFHMSYYDDAGAPQVGDFSSLPDPTSLGHSFAIPDLGVFVPLLGISDAAPPGSHNEITFSFKTGKAGIFRWQCFVPCGAGSIYGNGNAMSSFGYMQGMLVVQ